LLLRTAQRSTSCLLPHGAPDRILCEFQNHAACRIGAPPSRRQLREERKAGQREKDIDEIVLRLRSQRSLL
jgi:hypothetical protein